MTGESLTKEMPYANTSPQITYCLLAVCLSSCGGSSSSDDVVVGNKVPNFSLKALDGQKVQSQSYEGNVVMLNFWATWCRNCRKEIPMLKKIAKSTKAKVVGITLDDGGIGPGKPFVQTNDINYTILLGNERVFNRFQGLAIPYMLLLDRNQRIVRIYRGPVSEESLEEVWKKLS